jgi:hypothetical protein
MSLGAFRCRRCSWNQWVTVLGPLDTDSVLSGYDRLEHRCLVAKLKPALVGKGP